MPAEHIVKGQPVVLVVDDDRYVRMLARQALELERFTVEEAQGGHAALDILDRIVPDVVLLDVDMPEIDGFAVCSELRKRPETRNTPVLMMTGLNDVESINCAYEVGATDFVTKPPNWLILGHRVRYMIRAREAADELRISQGKLSNAQRIARLGWWEWDETKRHFSGSGEFFEILGLDAQRFEATLDAFMAYIHEGDRPRVSQEILEAAMSGETYQTEHRLVRPDGSERFVEQQIQTRANSAGQPSYILGTIRDVTDRKQDEQQIRFLAFYDSLTGLPNRRLLQERLTITLQCAARNGKRAAVLFLDLDRFKRVNDTMGHSAGDELLREAADRLKRCLRKSDCVARPQVDDPGSLLARLGGDEFVISLSEIRHEEDAARAARRVLDALAAPFVVAGQEVFVTASIGIATFPTDGETSEELLKNADTAMYHAKAKRRNAYRFYTPSMNESALKQLVLESDLQKAIELDELVLYYQPQLTTVTGRIVGAEALMRWRRPDGTLRPPHEFIAVAEETGLIMPMGKWALETACAQAKGWQEAGHSGLRVAVNVSWRQFSERDFPEIVSHALTCAGLDPAYLDIEVTETTVMENPDVSVESLRRITEMGVRISIDDFGTGYSSLGQLGRFAVTALKIDRSFMLKVPEDPASMSIVTTIIAMAKTLGLVVVAEGVEQESQLEILRALGCDEFQGFLVSPPVPAEQFLQLLSETTREPELSGRQ